MTVDLEHAHSSNRRRSCALQLTLPACAYATVLVAGCKVDLLFADSDGGISCTRVDRGRLVREGVQRAPEEQQAGKPLS